jgi:phenylpropionate dioxygenase-like ring-hydroxylating dioxygenase large terminal subunit
VAGITREENELLTRTGPGTPMGRLFRQYWIPAMLAERLPEPDGAPIAIQLLGEPLVAFRDTSGRVGLLDEFCPHRRASLVYGRNEECGLRCVYHGWKFDVTGQVLETPAERNPDFGKSIRHVAYPTREAGGIIWTYMGPEAEPPPFPDFLFTKLPAEQVIGFHYNMRCNYLQAIEGDLDMAHPSYLHGTISQSGPTPEHMPAMVHDTKPQTIVQEDWFGLQTVSKWKSPNPAKSMFWVDPFIMPFHTIVPARRTNFRFVWHAWVPIDDESHWLYYVHYDPEVPPGPDERRRLGEVFGHDLIDPADNWHSRGNLKNLHLLDRQQQKTSTYSGIRGIAAQDVALLESMGPLVDRTRQMLGSEDVIIAQLRRYLLKTVKEFMNGKGVPALDGRQSFADIDSRSIIVPLETSAQDVLKHREWRWGEIATA